MGTELKKSAPAFLTLFASALIIALLGRIGSKVLDVTGALGYNYRAATAPYLTDGLTTLDKLPFTMTGGTLVGFIFAGGLALCLATATALLFAHLYPQKGQGGIGVALVWGFASAIVAFVCLFIIVLGLYSEVLLSQMTKGGGGSLGLTLGMLVLAVGTLTAAASLVLRGALVKGAGSSRPTFVWVIATLAVCGAAVCALVCICFSAINANPASPAAIAGSLGAACICNLVMAFAGVRLGK
ncbi:hypothetical protein [Slackia heliotrinireducens]|uniref:hypothetical protein n=1 Tax=Slackia heliotrinireducens TaxID=84110 RepID=UPI0033158B6A